MGQNGSSEWHKRIFPALAILAMFLHGVVLATSRASSQLAGDVLQAVLTALLASTTEI